MRRNSVVEKMALPGKMNLNAWPAKVAVVIMACFCLLFATRTSSSHSFDRASTLLLGLMSSIRPWLVPPYVFVCIHLIVMLIWKLSEKEEGAARRDAVDDRKAVIELPRPSSPDPPPPPPPLHDRATPPPAGGDDPAESCDATPPRHVVEYRTDAAAPADGDGDGDSLEVTWQAIMDGGASPVRRYLTKSGTWAEQGRRLERAGGGNVVKEMRKSKTFRERSAVSSPAAAGRDVFAMGREEPDSKFEEFIRMTHERLRLQRMESHQRYLDMVRRGAAVVE